LSSQNIVGFNLMVPSNTSSKAAWQKIQSETPPVTGPMQAGEAPLLPPLAGLPAAA
jgi:hypothetical protein